MLNNFSITAHNFVTQKTLKIEGVIFEFLVLKITNFQCCVRKNGNLMTMIILADFSCKFTELS